MNLMIKVFLLSLLVFSAFTLTGIGLNPIRPFSLNKGKSTSYLFSITPEEEILTRAKIQIVFPSEFDQTKIAASLTCMAKALSYNWINVPCSYINSSVIITLGQIKNEETYILISKPLNPVTYTMSSYFSVCLLYDNTITTCNKQFGKVVFPNVPITTASTLTYPLVSSLNSNTAGQSSTYQFNFNLSASYPVGNTIRVKFPVGYSTTQSPICQMTGVFNQVIKTYVWPDQRSIQCININSTFVTNASQQLKIIGIYNPSYAGTFGNTNEGFSIEMLKESTTIVLEQIFLQKQITIQSGKLNGRIEQENNFIMSKTRYTFYINIQNALTSSNYIQMRFSNNWILYQQCSLISGLVMQNQTLSCSNWTQASYTYMNISNFVSASVSNQIVLSLMVGSPNQMGAYSVQTITGNNNGIMDQMVSQVTLNSTYGAINMLSINAITANAPIAVGATGPLQLTFFLNYPLPQTNVLTQGKFLLKIYPPIPLPSTITNGVLKCYFFNNIPASTCIWDNTTYPTYTLVTIKTPLTVSYQYSEIPITITTEGAVNDSMIGITIADVVTRYRFQLAAYTQANAVIPTEVFYTEYIAAAINVPLTYYALTNEINQLTHLRLQFVGPYNFPTAGYADDIRLKIEFLKTAAWADSLGFLPNQIYKRFPCTFTEDSTQKTPPIYNSDIVCDLYTYLDGPHASLSDTSVRGPYLLVYGFTNGLVKNGNYRLEVGGFKIGPATNTLANIRFSIIQQTPDMLTSYIELYYNQFTAFTTTSQSFTLLANQFSSTMTNSKQQVSNVHSNTFTTSSTSFAIIYQYDQSSTRSFTNQNFQCSTNNWCVKLGYPVNWIVQYKYTGSFTTSISSSFSFQNGDYAGSFLGNVRVFKSNMAVIYRSTFTYTYTPDTLYSYYFWLRDTTMYKGMEHYYGLYFRPYTTTPSNGFIRLTLSSEVLFGQQPYCVSSQIPVLDNNLGLLCKLQNSRSTLKIYNIGSLSAGTYYEFTLRIVSELTSASSIRPTITIATYMALNIDTSIIDQLNNLSLNQTQNNYYTNPSEFSIQNPKTSLRTPLIGYVGRFDLQFQPSSAAISRPATQISLYFHNHPWNGGFWSTPKQLTTDPLVCLINGKRVPCTYTLLPLVVVLNIATVGLNSGSVNTITLDTQYIAPQNGLLHPSQGGQYMTTITFLDSISSEIQKSSMTHTIKPNELRNLVIDSTVNDIGVENMFMISFQTQVGVTVNANNHATIYSRIFIEFPTVDTNGNALFAADLGGYANTGDSVGCSFYWSSSGSDYHVKAATSVMMCRLIKSEVYGDPVKVQIINHGAFTSTYRYMQVYIAKVFNPAIAVTSVPISIRIQHVQVSTNNIYQLYYSTYEVFMNSRNPGVYINNTRSTRSDSFQDGYNVNDVPYYVIDVRKVGSNSISSNGYYYALDMTSSFKPINNQLSPTLYCHGSYYFECLIFPEINYIIVHAIRDDYYVYFDLLIGNAISQYPTNLIAKIWQDGRLVGFQTIIMQASNWQEVVGDLYSKSFSVVGNSDSLAINRRKQEVQLSFYTRNNIPAGGSIQVVWPTKVPTVYPHCRSMTNIGSVLYAQSKTQNGQIGCMVQNTRNWVITSFQALPANSRIIINGLIDLPSSYHYLGVGYIYTYNNSDASNIRANGFIIDYLYDSNFDFYVANSNSWNADSQLTVQQTLPLRVGYTGPLQFKFQVSSTITGPKGGRFIVRVAKKSTISQSNGFSYVSNKFVCKIVILSTSQQVGCIVESVQDNNVLTYENIQFTVFTSQTLNAATPYKMFITTQTGSQPQGLVFPSAPGLYKVSLQVDTTSNSNYLIYNQMYIQVYGTSFKSLAITSMVTIPSQYNLIWFKLTPNTQIEMTEQIVIQFPTSSTAGLALFDNDIGTGIIDGGDIKVDIIGGDFNNVFMKCKLFKGDLNFAKSAKVVCAGFASPITVTNILFFALKIVNPALSGGRNQVSIPLFVYSNEQGKTYKKNFNVYQNAVFLRSDVYSLPLQGNLAPTYLQTTGSSISMIWRNYWAMAAGDYLVLFFGFPLRTNGIVANGCTNPIDSSIYGDAYYHQNIWAIVCTINNGKSNSSSHSIYGVINGVQRDLSISGFYTPWYYLSPTDQIITTYSYNYGVITSKAVFNDGGYPNVSPKPSSGATFIMTPAYSTAMYLGSRDDYFFQITYSSSANVDISYMRKIAIIFPNPSDGYGNNFQIVGQDCVQAVGSDIQVQRCWLEPGGRLIWIVPVVKTTYLSNMKLRIVTRDLAIRNPTGNLTLNMNRFAVYYYSWQNMTQPSLSPLSDTNYCFLAINNLPNSMISFSYNPSPYSVDTFPYIDFPHQRYYQETPYQALSHRAPIQLEFIPGHNFLIASGNNYHTISVTYPATFGDVASFMIRDLMVFRPVCYLNNNRVRQCAIDIANNVISMNFQFALSANTQYHLKLSILDPRSPDLNGFLSSSAISSLILSYQLAGTSTVYYMQTDQFASLFTLPTGFTSGPFRSITAGKVQIGTFMNSQLNVINLQMKFNRTDITGLVFEIPVKDTAGNYLYADTATLAAAFFNLENGATYPCGNNGLNAGGNVKCTILNGDITYGTLPTRIIMTDFTYSSQMNCRFIFLNPSTVNSFFSVIVKAYGGTKSATNLYGNLYMGQWEFNDIFQVTAVGSGTVLYNTYVRSNYKVPSQSPYRNNTSDYVFSQNAQIGAGRMSIAQVLRYDSGIGFTDKQICQTSLGSANDYDDLIDYTIVNGGRTQKYSYFITTWPTNTNVSRESYQGWTLSYIKCKYYQQSYVAYFYYNNNYIEVATNSFQVGNLGTYGSITAPTVMYHDQDYRFNGGTSTKFIQQIDFTATLNSVSNFYFRNGDSMVLLITVSSNPIWNNIVSCTLLGGIISTSEESPAYCEKASSNQIRIRNVAGFQTDPSLPVSKNKRVKFLYKTDSLVGSDQPWSSIPTKYDYIYLYANYDAYSASLQPIFSQSPVLLNNCHYPNENCYYSYGQSYGYFSLDALSDTTLRVTFKPYQNPDFSTSTSWNHYFRLQFHGFGFGSCTLSSVKAELTSTPTPGTGVNNTVDATGFSCSNNYIGFQFSSGQTFSNIFGGALPNSIWSSTQYMIFYIVIAPGTDQDLPVMHHQYIWMSGAYNYATTGGWTYQVRAVSYLPQQTLASSATLSTLTSNRGGVTELMIQVKSLNINIGSANSNYLLLAEFQSSSGWTGTNDPFKTYVNILKIKQRIQCKCLAGMGPLSSSSSSPFNDAKCYRRLPTTLPSTPSQTYTNYAILIDHPALKSQDIRCYFPEFMISTGLSMTAQFKTIYGDSYPIDLLGSSQYGSMYKITSNTLSFAGSTPTMGGTDVYGWNSLTENLYSSVVSVRSQFNSIYTMTGNFNNTYNSPYIYINFFKAGPIPVFSFCSSSDYYECRVYSNLIYVVVAKLKSTTASTFSITQGSEQLYYPPSVSSNASFNGFIYVGTTTWSRSVVISRSTSNLAAISSNTFIVQSDKYGSNRAGYNTNLLITMSTNGITLSNYTTTGSQIVITFSGVTQSSNCQTWVQNQVNIELQCIASTGTITIISRYYDYTTSNNIFVSLGITNPTVSSMTFSMVMYSYWYSASRYSLVISKSTTYAIDTTYVPATYSQLPKSRVILYPFRSKQFMTSNAPLRIRFKVSTAINYGSGYFILVNTQFQYSSSFLCYFKQYSSFTLLSQQTKRTMIQSPSCLASGTTLTVYPPVSLSIDTSSYWQLIMMPIGINIAGCGLYGCNSQSGFSQTNFQDLNFIAYSNYNVGPPTIPHQQFVKLYAYEGSSMIGLQFIYVLSVQPTKKTSLYVAFNLGFSAVLDFPQHYIEFTFFDLDSTSFTVYSYNKLIPCQLSSNFYSTVNRNSPQCKLTSADPVNNFVKIRIENIGNVSVNNYWVSFDDFTLPAATGADSTKKFDMSIGYFKPNSNLTYQNHFKQIFIMDGTITTVTGSLTSPSFTNPTLNGYGTPISGAVNFNWPFDSSTSGYESKVAINVNGGYAATWSDINALTFTESAIGTYLLLWVNTKLNKFVFKIPNKLSGVATTLSINNIRNPYPYQQTPYSTTTTLQLNFYKSFTSYTTQTIAQPVFGYFTKNPSIIYINQNLPSNTIDNDQNVKIAPSTLTKLLLSVSFDQTAANIVARQLDVIDILFTAGLSYIQECKFMKNDTTYANIYTICQTYYDGTNWHVKLYAVTKSLLGTLSTGWWVQIFAKFTSPTLTYTFSIMPTNLVVQYTSTYTVTLTNYDAAKTIPTQFTWMNRKYVSWYYENQVTLAQAVTGQYMHYFRFRFTVPASFDGGWDYIQIKLPNNAANEPFRTKYQSSNLICNLLPAISSQKDFSVGYYSPCSLINSGSYLYYNFAYIHGGLVQGQDLLLQITQNNIIDSTFYFPTTPMRTLISTYLYRNQSNTGYNHYDSFYINSYRYFTAAEIVHTTTTVNQYDTLRITYTPQGSLSAYSTSREIVLRLSVHARYIAFDGGIKSIYLNDGVTIYSGNQFSEVVSNPNNNEVTTVQFAQYTNDWSSLRFSLARQSAYVDGTSYIWRLPLLLNPSTAFVSLRYNLTLMEYPSSTSYGNIFNHYEIINDYYTQTDLSSVVITSIINNARNVQIVNGVDLSINLTGQSLATWDSVTFKLDKSLSGLIPSFSACNDTVNYNYYYFKNLQMVLAQKISSTNITTIGINSLSSTLNYQSTFGFKWVKFFNTSNTKQAFNPTTIYTSTPPTLTLNPFTTYTTPTISVVQGYEVQSSIVMYLLNVGIKIVPEGGELRVMFNNAKFTSNILGDCKVVGSGFVKSTVTSSVLRCYRALDGFVIAGFKAITTTASLSVHFYVKSLVAVTSSDITVNVFGVYRDNTTSISSAVVQSLTHTSGSYPTNIQRVQQMVINYYRSINGLSLYYQIQGTFKLRSTNLLNGMTIYMTDPFSQWGTRRLLVKQNVSSVVGWTELIPGSCSGSTQCSFSLPTNYINTLTLVVGQQYVWRYTTEDFTSNQNGFRIDVTGTYRYTLLAYTGSVYTEMGYEQFVPKAYAIQYTLSNPYPAAGRQTILDMQFSVNIDLATADQLSFTFPTNNLLYDMFQPDLEGNITTQAYRYLDCRQWSAVGWGNISDSRIICILYFGNRTPNPPLPATLVITTTEGFNGWPTAYNMRVLISNVKNPSTVNLNVGVQLNVNRPCVNIDNQTCPLQTARGWYVTKTGTQNSPAGVATFSSTNSIVLSTSQYHTFVIPLTADLATTDIIYIVYPLNYQGVMPDDCIASNSFTCFSFPTRRWIVLYPGTTYTGASVTVAIHNMKNGYYSRGLDPQFKITVARASAIGDVYYITPTPLTPITSSISMTITATQTPQIWLRNYDNTAIFKIDNLFMDDRIKAIYLKAPAEVLSWHSNYCNASITGTIVNTYPLRFICTVDPNDASFLRITRDSQQSTWSSAWATSRIQIHAQFLLTDFAVGQPVLYVSSPINSGLFYAYGSVNIASPISYYYLSQTSQYVSISEHLVPIISDITFDQKSFAYRVAKVNSKEVFYLLLNPTINNTQPIGQIIFTIPEQFGYPGVFSLDNCYMLGRRKYDQYSCQQSRQAGRTLIKLTPNNYDQAVKIIQLGSSSVSNWYTAPSLPGDFYNMTVQIYSTLNVLLEKQTVDISPVYGSYFDIPSIKFTNIKEANLVQSVYDLTFITGSLQIPPGAPTTATLMTSQLQFVFQNYNAFIVSNIFNNDLRTGLKNGDQVGCVIRAGIVALENLRIKCIIHLGTNSTDKPMIKIINYGFINPSTTIKVSFAAIQSLPQINANTMSIGVMLYYNDALNSSTYLYILTPVLPTPTNATSQDVDRNMTGWWWNFYSYFQGANVVLQPTGFVVRFIVPYQYAYSGYHYTSSGSIDQFILLKFTPKFVIDPNNMVNISCASCSQIQVFYATGIIRFRHTQDYSGGGYQYITFNNFPTFAYAVANLNVAVNIEIYDNYRLLINSPTLYIQRTVQKCIKFGFGVLSVSSLNGGQNGITYLFSIKTNHFIPAQGAITITIPSSYGNMVTNNATCKLIGFSTTNAYCQIVTPSRIDIYLNGSELSQTTSYQIQVAGIQNPNNNASTLSFVVSSYYNHNLYQNKIICQNQIVPPLINVKSLRECTLEWQPDYYNMNFNATYSFYVSCSDIFRADSMVYIVLPSQYSTKNKQGTYICSSYESTTLKSSTCTLKYINGSLMLYANLDATTSSSFSVITNFVNPINNTYQASVFVMSKGVKYAKTNDQTLTILSNTYVNAGQSSVNLMNNPKEGGLMSTYIFKILPITSFSPDNLAIKFPKNFYLNQAELSIGMAITNVGNLFDSLTYNNIQILINNVSSVNGVSLNLFPTFSVLQNTIYITNITGKLSSKLWSYVLIRGIKNPSMYTSSNFTISYYIQTVVYRALKWVYSYPLVYFISPPPNYLTISNITVSDYDLLYPSIYAFTFVGSNGSNIAIAGKQLSYVIVIPTFYKSTLWANTAPVCKFTQLSSASKCYSYDSQIIITETFASNMTNLTLSITTILNPSLPTQCNTTDVALLGYTFFQIRIIEVLSNAFLFESSAVVDSSNCLTFKSMRIPITLEYSLIMVAGLTYNITYGLTKPASNLKIKAVIQNQTGFTFSPSMVQFNDFYTLKNSTTLYLRSDIAAGTYIITFTKYQSQQNTYFRNILPITITVINAANQANLVRPTISINPMTASTVGYPVRIPITFSMPSSTPMTLFMSVLEQSNSSLSQYNPSFKNFSLQPRILPIQPQSSNYSLTLQHMQRTIPPPLTLTFKLTSLYPIIHNLTTTTIYLCFDQDPKFKVLEPPMRITVTDYLASCNTKDIGKAITNIYALNSSTNQNATVNQVLPIIVSINSTNIMSTSVDLLVNLDSSSTIYYICLPSGEPAVTDKALIKAMNSTIGLVGTSTSSALSIYSGVASQINYQATISLRNLSPTSAYDIYVYCESTLGQSVIKQKSFTTTDISKGVLMKLSFSSIVQSLTIVQTLQRILRISPLRIKVLTSNYDLQQMAASITSKNNALQYIYQVVIAPDAQNDIKTPLNIVSSFVSNSTSTQQLKTAISAWNQKTAIPYYQLRVVKPRVINMPKPSSIYTYNCTFAIKMWEASNIYAVLIQQKGQVTNSLSHLNQKIVPVRVSSLTASDKASAPSSNQIRSGLDKNNIKLTKYRYFSSTTLSDGTGNVFFDDLQPGTKYNLYLTSSSILPYEPTYLWSDGEVITLTFNTLYNQALKNQDINLDELNAYKPSLAAAMKNFLKNSDKNQMNSLNTN